jgi:hypothetical protein
MNFSLNFVKILIITALLNILKNLLTKFLLKLGIDGLSILQSIMKDSSA